MSAATLPPPDLNPAAPYPEVAAAQAALAARDWSGFRGIFDGLDWAGRGLVVDGTEASGALETFLSDLVRQNPADAVAHTVLGALLVDIGWSIRTGARAQNVTADQFRQFHDYLRRAEQSFIEATAREPGLAVAWVERLTTARGLELGESEARRRYDHLTRADPHNFTGQFVMIQNLCPKWGGTFEKVHTFARECMLTAPAGAPNASVIGDGHYEHWVSLKGDERTAYLRDPAVRAELHEAAARSIFSPQWTPGRGWVRAMNVFALLFCLTEQWPAAQRCFLAIGPYISVRVWNWLSGEPGSTFVANRMRAFSQGGVA